MQTISINTPAHLQQNTFFEAIPDTSAKIDILFHETLSKEEFFSNQPVHQKFASSKDKTLQVLDEWVLRGKIHENCGEAQRRILDFLEGPLSDKSLDLSGLKLRTLPDVFSSPLFFRLQCLVLDKNELEFFPDSLAKLRRLKKLSLNGSSEEISLPFMLFQLMFGSEFPSSIEETGEFIAYYERKTIEGLSFNGYRLEGVAFNGVVFKNCRFDGFSFLFSRMRNCVFVNCEFFEAFFNNSLTQNVEFVNCKITSSSFEDGALKDTRFIDSGILSTQFLDTRIQNVSIRNCNLEGSLFFGLLDEIQFPEEDVSKESVKGPRPITALLRHPLLEGMTVLNALTKLEKESSFNAIRVSYLPHTFGEELNREMHAVLKVIDSSSEPIPWQIIKRIMEDPREYPSCFKIIEKARKLAQEVDSFFLPGGEDVPPSLYGDTQAPETYWGEDYTRSLFELAIIHQSFTKGIPLMGVCRGFQIANVYFGASLMQNLSRHCVVWQELLVSKKEFMGLIFETAKKGIQAFSNHLQGVLESESNYLDHTLSYDRVVKASELKYSASVPMILLQFHPEQYTRLPCGQSSLRESNAIFWKIFFDGAKSYQVKKLNVLELKSEYTP
jgi:gamma-glutamyl-gamma-aminobutyrate hydrolase PuuD